MHADEIALEKVAVRLAADRIEVVLAARPPVLADTAKAAIDKPGRGSDREARQSGRQRVWQQPVVGVEKDHLVGLSVAQSGVASRRETLVRPPNQPDSGIPRDDRAGIVGRAVVDNEDVCGGPGLGEHAFDGVAEKVRVIVRGDHDTGGRRDRSALLRSVNHCGRERGGAEARTGGRRGRQP